MADKLQVRVLLTFNTQRSREAFRTLARGNSAGLFARSAIEASHSKTGVDAQVRGTSEQRLDSDVDNGFDLNDAVQLGCRYAFRGHLKQP